MGADQGIGSYLESVDLGSAGNLEDTDNWLFGTSLFFIPLVIMFVVARLTWRARKKTFGCDDWFMTLAGTFFVPLIVLALLACQHGVGKHAMALLVQHPESAATSLSRVIQLLFGCYVAYSVSILFTKLSILGSYHRVYPNYRKLVLVIGLVCITQAVSSIIVPFFMCRPMKSIWDPTVRRISCISIQAFFTAIGVINAAMDFAICFLGVYFVWGVQTSWTQKKQLIIVYSLGLFACIVSCVRIGRLQGLQSSDITYTCVMPISWSVIEAAVGIIVGCLPPLKSFWNQQLLPRFRVFLGMAPTTTLPKPRVNNPAHAHPAHLLALRGPPTPFSRQPRAPETSQETDPSDDKDTMEMGDMSYHNCTRDISQHDASRASSIRPPKEFSPSTTSFV